MNNYSWLQQKLHQLALSSQFMRETTFDIESSIISTKQQTGNHVFVAGLARSGTTILLNAIFASNQFSSLSYQDMPFILAPNLWSKLSFGKKNGELVERAHGDGIEVSSTSPEAFEEVFWMTFDQNNKNKKEKFKSYVELINRRYQKKRYLSKNNQNIKRVDVILKILPNAKILIPFRSPLQHSYSLLNQHKRFVAEAKKDSFVSDYMYWIGHTEFGPNYKPINDADLNFKSYFDINHWLEQWYLTYDSCSQLYQNHKNVGFISYEKLCNSKDYWDDILKFSEVDRAYPFEFKEATKKVDVKYDTTLLGKSERLYEQLNKLNFLFKKQL